MNNNKITAEHLARQACVYVRQSTPDQVKYNLKVNAANMVSRIVRVRWVGKTSMLSMTISESQETELPVPALNACCAQCAMGRWVRSLASRRRGWRAMAGSGTRCWNFAASWVSF